MTTKMKHDDAKMDKASVKKAVGKHEKNMHPGKPITKLAHGGGVKVRGTGAATKGLMARGPMA
jgi:hypothetical protein|tara:strand:+ start:242 stop:430 length:189 start_codon:yes stop_codon:yes gene_type:complete